MRLTPLENFTLRKVVVWLLVGPLTPLWVISWRIPEALEMVMFVGVLPASLAAAWVLGRMPCEAVSLLDLTQRLSWFYLKFVPLYGLCLVLVAGLWETSGSLNIGAMLSDVSGVVTTLTTVAMITFMTVVFSVLIGAVPYFFSAVYLVSLLFLLAFRRG